jgi:hypothetical protein
MLESVACSAEHHMRVLQDCSSEEEALESLHENVASLIKLLEAEGKKPVENKGEVI